MVSKRPPSPTKPSRKASADWRITNHKQNWHMQKSPSGFCCCNCSPPPTKPSRKAPSPPPKLFFESLIGAPVEHISQLTIFRAESAPKVSAVFVVASAHLHLPTRIAKHLRHKFYSFWNLLPEHRSNSITHGKKNKRSQDEILRTEKCPAKIVPVRVRRF